MGCTSDPPPKWLVEPSSPDPTFANREEPTLEWLARSTVHRAVECRRFLNENLAALPSAAQSGIWDALHTRWHSAFFELILARLLQLLGATIRVEVENSRGKKPDFLAQFPDSAVVVEAVSPVVNAEAGEELKRRSALLNIIEAHAPADWRIGVLELPNLGPTDSKKRFKAKLSEMLSQLFELPRDEPRILEGELPQGMIRLWVRSAPGGKYGLVYEPGIISIDNTEQRIRNAVTQKKKQVRGSQGPVLLAIHAAGISSELEDFDKALFGRTYSRAKWDGEEIERGFQIDGEFMNQRQEAPVYAGVLAFTEVGFRRVYDPVLYLHPRFSGALPEAILGLEQRSYGALAGAISIKPAKIVDLASGLNPVER